MSYLIFAMVVLAVALVAITNATRIGRAFSSVKWIALGPLSRAGNSTFTWLVRSASLVMIVLALVIAVPGLIEVAS